MNSFGYRTKLIVCGMALILFALIIAVIDKSSIAYIIGGLGLALILIACFVKSADENISETDDEIKNHR